WEQWIAFFLRGVREVAREAVERSKKIIALRESHHRIVQAEGKAAGNLARALDHLFSSPIVTANSLATALNVSYVTANNLVGRLVEMGILMESTGYQRNRKFRYAPYLVLFEGV